MNNKRYRRNFTPSDDALILEQPVTGIGLKTLATMLGTSQQKVLRRADELGVSLVIGSDHDTCENQRPRQRMAGAFLLSLKRRELNKVCPYQSRRICSSRPAEQSE